MKISAAYAYLNETIALSRHETEQLINRHAQYFLTCLPILCEITIKFNLY